MNTFETDKLFSNFIVMGVNINQEEITFQKIHDGKIVPTFLDVYPSFPQDKVPQNLEKFEMFCFSDGFKIFDENFKLLHINEFNLELSPQDLQVEKKNAEEKPNTSEELHSFVMTDGDSNRRYCSSLLFYEKYYLRRDQSFCKKEKNSTLMPKTSLQDLVKYPYTMNDHTLIYLPKSVSLISTTPCFETQRQILRYFYKSLFAKRQEDHCTRDIKVPKFLIQEFEALLQKYGRSEIDEVWSQTFVSTAQNIPTNNECFIIKESQLKEFYLSVLFSLMDSKPDNKEKIYIKICNDNKTEDKEFARYRIPSNRKGLPQIDYSCLFKSLSIENIIQIFKCILTERQIIFFSSVPGDIPFIGEALLGLLGPLKWCCMYVPFFPICLWEHLHALMPYIVGINSIHKQFIASRIDLTDKIVVDLDTNSFYFPENIPDFPQNVQEFLNNKLRELSHQLQPNMQNSKLTNEFWAEITLKTKHYFDVALLALTNNLLPFFYLPQDYNSELRYTASDVFNSDLYFSQFDKENIQFLTDMHNTMMFTNFLAEVFDLEYIENNYIHPPKSEELKIFVKQLKELEQIIKNDPSLHYQRKRTCAISGTLLLFDAFHPQMLNHIFALNETPIKNALERIRNPLKIDLFPFLIKYFYAFFYKKDDKEQTNNELLLIGSKKSYHARHASLASLVSINQDDAKTLNKSWQNFTALNKMKVVNLNKLFEKSISSRKVFSISDFIENKDINKIIGAEFQRKKDENSADHAVSKNKPELVKRVIQKLESDDFIFKPHNRKKSEAMPKLVRGLHSHPQQINETDEFLLEELNRNRGKMETYFIKNYYEKDNHKKEVEENAN